jgi:hypothetical protein
VTSVVLVFSPPILPGAALYRPEARHALSKCFCVSLPGFISVTVSWAPQHCTLLISHITHCYLAPSHDRYVELSPRGVPESAGKVIRVPRVNAIAKRDTICRDAKVINGSITELREAEH